MKPGPCRLQHLDIATLQNGPVTRRRDDVMIVKQRIMAWRMIYFPDEKYLVQK